VSQTFRVFTIHSTQSAAIERMSTGFVSYTDAVVQLGFYVLPLLISL
jgi:hypothetical protein